MSASSNIIDDLIDLLDREASLDALSALAAAVRPVPSSVPLGEVAIGIDANVFLRLAGHKDGADIIDYLDSTHRAPLILPGQAVQEFWNNQLSVVTTVGASIKKKVDQLTLEVATFTGEDGSSTQLLKAASIEFVDEHSYIYDEKTIQRLLSLINVLRERALTAFSPRSALREVCEMRRRTKTPPGFRDDGDGDFYIWADYLLGLKQSSMAGGEFEKAVLITLDKKPDWSREGIPHPVLAAEAVAFLGVPFEIWTIDQLAKRVAEA